MDATEAGAAAAGPPAHAGAVEHEAIERPARDRRGAGADPPPARLVDLDFPQPLAFAVLAVLYVVSRIPWLDMGYGTDPAAWRVALSAHYLLDSGEYLPSRLPGYPLHEFVTVPLVKAGWVWTNLSTVGISLVGVYLFARLAERLELPAPGALVLGFAFAPLLWINSVTTMDYMWGLTCILAAYLLACDGRAAPAGVAVGLAAGVRLLGVAVVAAAGAAPGGATGGWGLRALVP